MGKWVTNFRGKQRRARLLLVIRRWRYEAFRMRAKRSGRGLELPARPRKPDADTGASLWDFLTAVPRWALGALGLSTFTRDDEANDIDDDFLAQGVPSNLLGSPPSERRVRARGGAGRSSGVRGASASPPPRGRTTLSRLRKLPPLETPVANAAVEQQSPGSEDLSPLASPAQPTPPKASLEARAAQSRAPHIELSVLGER